MKLNYTKGFDLEKLDENVEKFEMIHNVDAYLVMSYETSKLLYETCIREEFDFRYTNNNDDTKIWMYKGNTILSDDSLPFGVVDIR